jgi:uncharacterized protein (DUF486 family)
VATLKASNANAILSMLAIVHARTDGGKSPCPLKGLDEGVAVLREITNRGLTMTILLLFGSNVFMTIAWYGHLKYGHGWPLWKAILVSWGIALIEYCMSVPANRLGFGAYSGFQLKIIQEAITLTVFLVFAVVYLKEKMAWNYAVSFALLIAAVVVAFAFKPVAA